MVKQILKKHSRLLFVGLCTLMTSVNLYAFNFEKNGIYYSINDDGTSVRIVSGSSKYTGDVTIPSKVADGEKTYSVTSIGDWAFDDCSGLTSINIPSSVTRIGERAFEDCSELTSITIPSSVTNIGNWAFCDCSKLTSINIPNSVTSIGGIETFMNTPWYNNQPDGLVYAGLIAYRYKGTMPRNTSISIKEGTKGIADKAFEGCSDLTSITIPNSFTSIGDWAFYGCSGLTSINIPNSVTSIGNNAFSNCSNLTSITIPNAVTNIGDKAFSYCSKLTSINIPNSVTSIGNNAFSNCSNLTSITIPDSVTNIGNGAFSHCSGLTSITIPNAVTSIEDNAFDGCSGLTSITIPNSVTSIGTSAFYGCSELTSITIPNSVTNIGNWAFCDCSKLTSINIPNSVTSIGGIKTFMNTPWYNNQPDGLVYAGLIAYRYKGTMPQNTSISIKEGTKGIGGGAFEDCSELTSINIPNSVISIGGGAFYGCSGLTSINIPNSVTNIGINAFMDTPWHNNQPNGLVYAGLVAYKYKGTMPQNTSISIKEGTKQIADYAFSECSGLTSINIPNSVANIGTGVFYGCTKVTELHIHSITPPTLGSSAFDEITNCTLYVPTNSINAYKSSNWTEYPWVNIIGEEETGISQTISNSNKNSVSFDLLGRQKTKTSHGLIIVNGKKIIR